MKLPKPKRLYKDSLGYVRRAIRKYYFSDNPIPEEEKPRIKRHLTLLQGVLIYCRSYNNIIANEGLRHIDNFLGEMNKQYPDVTCLDRTLTAMPHIELIL